jgi:hypothetical protein
MALLEFLFYGSIIYERIELIRSILRIDKGLRELINLIDYENGWNFIFLSLLLISCLLTFKPRKVAWLIKQIGLICLLVTLGFSITNRFSISYIGIIVILLIIYYSLNKVSDQFNIVKSEKMKYYLISAAIVIMLLAGYIFIGILNY